MTEEVTLSRDGTYILVLSEGRPSLAEMQQTLPKIQTLSRDHNVRRVLVDSRARDEQPSVLDIYRGGELVAAKLRYVIRIAVLVREKQPDHTFFKNVALNRGASVEFFQEETTALEWLFRELE